MAEIVRMPKLSDTMEEGVVAEWHKNVGDQVESGELLAEIETDKATMEFESFQDGTLLYIGVKKGETAPVDSVLCILGEKGEAYEELLASDTTSTTPEEPAKAETKEEESSTTPAQEHTTVVQNTETTVASTSVSDSNRLVKASPLARKLAEEKGVDLTQVSGTGEGGRIVKIDIENFIPNQVNTTAFAASSSYSVTESFEDVPVTQMRKTIAKRLGESKFTAPHFYLTVEVDMDNAIAARKAVNGFSDQKVSFNDIVIKATSLALKKHPAVNSSWLEDKIRVNHHVNIGVAVAVPDGLVVPVVRYADTKPLSQINSEVRNLAGMARDKKLQPKDWEGNTFTISNLGMFGIEEFTAIINAPDSCILAVGGIVEKPVVKNGTIQVGNTMKLTLSCDHRVVDGATGSEFLQTLKQMLEQPLAMLA